MKLEELRRVIHEEVVKAIREEIRDILTEAVEIASRPEEKPVISRLETRIPSEAADTGGTKPIWEILNSTAKEMTREDYKAIVGDAVIQSESPLQESTNIPGAGVSGLPDFVQRAKSILDASNEIDKRRHAI